MARAYGTLLLCIVTLALALESRAQTCTRTYTSSTSIATITSELNDSNITHDGSLVCFQRRDTWTSATCLTLSASHADGARVTLCASSGGTCSDTGGAQPALTITASVPCVQFASGASGYSI